MNITADAVKQLRERTGAGMMECKRALVETHGDLDAAAELMRKTGLAKADKKAARVAAEGTLATMRDGLRAVLVEVNCETDFVARSPEFQAYANDVARAALKLPGVTVEALLSAPQAGGTLDERRRALIAKIGENISVRHVAEMTAPTALGSYLHGGRLGALVALQGGDDALAKELAMHVVSADPKYIDASAVPAAVLDKERGILAEQTKGENKPPEIIAKMIEGRLRKYLAGITLVGQPFIKDPDTSVEKLLKNAGATVVQFVRLQLGEGIEKKQDDFVNEVMAQVKASTEDKKDPDPTKH
jgi:elongation factor Ts